MQHFRPYREQTVGTDATFHGPYGEKRILYADWIASGRLYAPIERQMRDVFGPFVANTHSESSITGTTMTHAYHHAHQVLKRHVNAGPDDVILTPGTGMTAAVCKLQRILGLSVPDQARKYVSMPDAERPVVFITHMEHHSNQTSWLETLADVVVIGHDENGLADVDSLREHLHAHRDRRMKIGSFTGCSNVTGVSTPYRELARAMHEAGGWAFVDFAASAPYVDIDMHPADPLEKLDAVFFSPHKFLGGPGSPGVLIFDKALYRNRVPDVPGGGTVAWTNPWGEHSYVDDIEAREDGGTPGFLQAIRAALAVKLKEEMGTDKIAARERELLARALPAMRSMRGVHVLAEHLAERIGVVSFYVEDVHYNLVVKLLNDRFGIQVRGGCSCAGTYGHFLLHVDRNRSRQITERIDAGDLSAKPGWVRLSLHPTMTDNELAFTLDALEQTVRNANAWAEDYRYDPQTNEYYHRSGTGVPAVQDWFELRTMV